MIALVLALVLTGCASLPPTNLPVCGTTCQFEEVCRAPVLGRKEHGRDRAWEAENVCPNMKSLERHPGLTTCYAYAGVRDSRQVYRRQTWRKPEAR